MKHFTLKSILRLIGFSFFLLPLSFSLAQVTTEQLYHGAADLALAGSNVAHQTDAWAAFENPAGLAQLEGLAAALGYENTFGQSYLPHSMAAVAYPLGTLGAAGLALDYVAVNYGGHQLTGELAFALTHGFYLQRDRNSTLALGYALKYLQVDYGKSAGPSGDGSDGTDLGRNSTVGLDLGLTTSLRERYRLGVQVLNINSPELGNSNAAVQLPRAVRVGLAYSPYNLVWTNFALIRSIGHDTQYAAGLEYQIIPAVTLLSGVQSNPNRLGVGCRLRLKALSVDYGLLTHPVLPVTHQFALGVAL